MKKKSLPTILILCMSAALVFSYCKKSDPAPVEPAPTTLTTEVKSGMGDKSTSLNGYLYACYMDDQKFNSSSKFFFGFATFSDPAKNLMSNYDHSTDQLRFDNALSERGNVSIPTVQFSGHTFFSSASPTSCHNIFVDNDVEVNNSAKWVSSGNKTFSALNSEVPRGFPYILSSSPTLTASLQNDLTINISSIVSNADSVTVRLSQYNTTFGPSLQKTVVAGTTFVRFTGAELSSNFNGWGPGYIQYKAYNYSNQIVQDKSYLYELSYKLEQQIHFIP